MESGLEVKFQPGIGCYLYKNSVLMGTAVIRNRLFLLDTQSINSQKERSGGREHVFFEATTQSKPRKGDKEL